MKVVWKYKLGLEKETQSIKMPRWSTILDVQLQDGEPVMWALVDPNASMIERLFIWVFTGEKSDDWNYDYIGTIQVGPMVYHLFEEIEEIPF